MNFSKKAMDISDYFNRCQSDLKNTIPELTTDIYNRFLVKRTSKTDIEPFRERFGIELPGDLQDYINLYWHTYIYGAYDCDKQSETGVYYKFDEGLILFPVMKHSGETNDDVLFQKCGVYKLTEELYEDYEEDEGIPFHRDLGKEVKNYICIGWTEYAAHKILYKVSTGEIYLESLMEEKVVDDKPIASSLPELINKLYFLN